MPCALLSALKSWTVPAALLAVGLAVAGLAPGGIEPQAIQAAPAARLAVGAAAAGLAGGGIAPGAIGAAAAGPAPGCPAAMMGFRFPAPDQYPHQDMPWIGSREEFIAYLARGEDPAVVRRYVAG